MTRHRLLQHEHNHVVQSLVYADAAARTAASGFAAEDVGRNAFQESDSTFWLLKNHDPATWVQLGTVAATSVPVGGTVFVDAVAGSDTTGEANNAALPFQTLDAAVSAAVALGPTVSSQVAIEVRPGGYAFGGPPHDSILPSYCHLRSSGGAQATTITAAVPSGPIVTLFQESSISELSLVGANASGGIGLKCVGAGDHNVAFVLCFDCETPFYADGINVRVLANTFIAVRRPTEIITTAFVGKNGADLTLPGCLCLAAGPTKPETGLLLDDAKVLSSSLLLQAQTGLALRGSATGELSSIKINGDIGLHLDATADGEITLANAIIESDTWSVLLESAEGSVFLADCVMDGNRISNPGGGTIQGTWHARDPNEPIGIITEGPASIGSARQAASLAIAGGAPHAFGMAILSNNNLESGTWTDNTADAIDITTTFSLFQSIVPGNAAYIGDVGNFSGLEIDVVTALGLGTGSIALEYSKDDGGGQGGVTWEELPYSWMTSEADTSITHGKKLLHLPQRLYMRFRKESDWVTKELFGYTKKWLRFRIVDAINVIPVLRSVRLCGNLFLFNDSGFPQAFGDSQWRPTILIQDTAFQPVGSVPLDQDLFPGPNTAVGLVQNVFSSGDRIGFALPVPANANGSEPMEMSLRWQSTSADLDPVLWEAFATPIAITDIVKRSSPGILEEFPVSVLSPAPGEEDKGTVSRLAFDISTIVTSEEGTLSILIRRGFDQHNGNAIIRPAGVSLRYTACFLGSPL